jgi:hypothetical protein
MLLRGLFLSSAFLLVATVAAPDAAAEPITVTFTAFPDVRDPVNIGASTGFFTFDSSLIPEGGGRLVHDTGLGVTEVDFRWGRTLWTAANADLGYLEFGPSGELLGWTLGDSPGIWGWTYAPAANVVDDIWLNVFTDRTTRFGYTNAGYEGLLLGRLFTDSASPPIPEPATVLLIGTGLTLLARVRRRRAGATSLQ